MAVVHVHIEHPTARSRYVIKQLIERMLGWPLEFVNSTADLAALKGPRLVYGQTPVEGAFHIHPHGLLEDEGIGKVDPKVSAFLGVPILFPSDLGDLPYDLFAGAFFLLTAYEECSGIGLDEHGRPLSKELHSVRHGYVHRPVVDEWALQLAKHWKAKDPNLPVPDRKYEHVVTVDLDNGFMYRGREWWRTVGSAVRDLLNARWTNVIERFHVLRGKQKDPYDVYQELRKEFAEVSDRTIFFVLTAPRSEWAHAVPVSDPSYAGRLKELSEWAEIGLHPSYRNMLNSELIAKEKKVLQEALGKVVTLSRHHFLRITVPDSFPQLVRNGFVEDHTMGLHDTLGFRVGTCTPYVWFDLNEQKELPITIHPFCVMDNTLRNKLKLDPDAAVHEATELIKRVRDVQGTFIGLWHESFLSDHGDHRGWGSAIRRIINNARS